MDANGSYLFLGMAVGLGVPGVTALAFLIRMENRITHLEAARLEDEKWRAQTTTQLTSIARDVNRLIGESRYRAVGD